MKNIKRFFYFSVLFQVLLFTQCVDEITLNIDGEEPRLVIDGLIADQLDTYTIRINKSAVLGVGTDNIFEPIRGARVKVVDDNGGEVEFIEGDAAGIYAAEMAAIPGVTYHVDIQLADGKKVLSRPAILVKAPEIDTITAEVVDESVLTSTGNAVIESNVIMKVTTDLSEMEEKPFMRWRADGEYAFREGYPGALNTKLCFIKSTLDINVLKIFDTRKLGGDIIKDEPFIETAADFRFSQQFCLHVFQYSMTEEEFIYWDAVQDVISIDGSLFDPPPGPVRGNLYNPADDNDQIAGYFSVNGVKSLRTFINPTTLSKTNILPKCAIRFRFVPGPDCLDCLSVDRSTLERPSYWE